MAKNGLGLTVEQTAREIEQIKRFWVWVPDVPLFEEWERLVRLYKVSGTNTHDALLVAAMHMHGIESIFTFNVKDFARFENITVIDPATIS